MWKIFCKFTFYGFGFLHNRISLFNLEERLLEIHHTGFVLFSSWSHYDNYPHFLEDLVVHSFHTLNADPFQLPSWIGWFHQVNHVKPLGCPALFQCYTPEWEKQWYFFRISQWFNLVNIFFLFFHKNNLLWYFILP